MTGTPEAHERFVYADNAATTKIAPEALDAMMPYLTEGYANANGFYSTARDVKRTLESCRERVAGFLGAMTSEIYFTSGGTESDNWAIRGALELNRAKGKHVITSAIEHHAITHTLDHLERIGDVETTYLPVDARGHVSAEDLAAAIRPDTVLVSIMLGNNEIGTILRVKELAQVAREAGVLFHTDAVQAVGHIPVDVAELGVDMLSLSAHKFHGPKSTGVLYIRKGVRLPALITGGGHENGKRSGTENIANIVGLTEALALSMERMPEEGPRVAAMRDRLMDELTKRIPYSYSTGDREERLPGIASIIFEYIEGEAMTLMMDAAGIAVSSGSACSSGSLDPSHVLLALGLEHGQAHGSLRMSLSDYNTDEDVDYIIETLPSIIERLRAFSPVWDDKVSGLRSAGIERVEDDPEAFAHRAWGY